MRSFQIPARFVPEQTITRCEDCPDFENRGGSYGEYDACRKFDRPNTDIQRKWDEDIPADCPRIENKI